MLQSSSKAVKPKEVGTNTAIYTEGILPQAGNECYEAKERKVKRPAAVDFQIFKKVDLNISCYAQIISYSYFPASNLAI